MDNTCTSTPEILRTPQEARRRTVDANEWYTSSDPSQQRPTTLGAHSSMFNELTHGFPSRCALPRETAVPDVVTFVTGTIPSVLHPNTRVLDWIIVAPRNDDDDMYNKFLSTIPGKEQVFYNADTVTQEAGAGNETFGVNTFPVGPIHSLATSNLPPGELRPKPGFPPAEPISPTRILQWHVPDFHQHVK